MESGLCTKHPALLRYHLHIGIIIIFRECEANRWHNDPKYCSPMITASGTQIFVVDFVKVKQIALKEPTYVTVVNFLREVKCDLNNKLCQLSLLSICPCVCERG